jgi:four helix bundle protein
MDKNRVLDKALNFAVRVTNAHKYLVKSKNEHRISDQLYRSGTSIQANISEAQYAISHADFICKMQIALKEANESRNWITLLHKTNYIDDRTYESIYNDVNEIVMMLIAILKTAKNNSFKN